jgi:hypothetical protein
MYVASSNERKLFQFSANKNNCDALVERASLNSGGIVVRVQIRPRYRGVV